MKKSNVTRVPVMELDDKGRLEYMNWTGRCNRSEEPWTETEWHSDTQSRTVHKCYFKDIEDFTAILEIAGSRRGRSAAQVIVSDEYGNEYTMFMAGFLAALEKSGQYPIIGTFRHVKKGSNYGIEMI